MFYFLYLLLSFLSLFLQDNLLFDAHIYKLYLAKDPKDREPLIEFEKQTFGISSLALSATITYLWGISKIFENSKGTHHPIPNLMEMLENREKQLFGIV